MINGGLASVNGSMVIINAKPPLKEIVAANDNYPKGWHEGNPGGLDAIDTDLAVGNIKEAVTIFGKLGTFAGGPLVDDATETAIATQDTNQDFGTRYNVSLAAGTEFTVATVTETFAAVSRAVAVGHLGIQMPHANGLTVRLYMGGALVTESATLVNIGLNYTIIGTRALSGAQDCVLKVYRVGATADMWLTGCKSSGAGDICGGIGVGSIKI